MVRVMWRHIVIYKALLLFILSACSSLPDNVRWDDSVDSVTSRQLKQHYLDDLQYQLRQINQQGLATIDDSRYCAAATWLDVAQAEYANNGRGNFTKQSVIMVERALAAIKEKQQNIERTAVLRSLLSNVIRPDLWSQTQPAEQACQTCNAAKSEVYLLWATYQDQQLGWRQASPSIALAERLLGDSINQQSCKQNAVPMLVNTDITPRSLHVFFDTDSSKINAQQKQDISEFIVLSLQQNMQQPHCKLDVLLVGQADTRGADEYNYKLGLSRAHSVRSELMQHASTQLHISTLSVGEFPQFDSKQLADNMLAEQRKVQLLIRGKKCLDQH